MNESQTPNGGWCFYEAKTKFTIDRRSKPSSVSLTLGQASELVQKHRLANPQLGLATGYHQVKAEIINYNRHRLGMPAEDSPPKSLPQQPQRVAAVAGHASKTTAGIKLVIDWLGSGLRPVNREEAERRAAICATCPQNQTGDLWQRIDAKAAEGLKRLISIKSEMALATSHDAKLKTCLACDCWNPLKVWAPLDHILKNTSDEVKANLDPRCWIK